MFFRCQYGIVRHEKYATTLVYFDEARTNEYLYRRNSTIDEVAYRLFQHIAWGLVSRL
jgi:hypothetical protein